MCTPLLRNRALVIVVPERPSAHKLPGIVCKTMCWFLCGGLGDYVQARMYVQGARCYLGERRAVLFWCAQFWRVLGAPPSPRRPPRPTTWGEAESRALGGQWVSRLVSRISGIGRSDATV